MLEQLPDVHLLSNEREPASHRAQFPRLKDTLKKTGFISCLYFYLQYKDTEGDSGHGGPWMPDNFCR